MSLTSRSEFTDALSADRRADPVIHITSNDTGVSRAWCGWEINAFTEAFQSWANVDGDFGSVPSGTTHFRQNDVNNVWSFAAGMARGGYTYETFVHEIGQALGLAHPRDSEMGTGLFPAVTFNVSDDGVHAWLACKAVRQFWE